MIFAALTLFCCERKTNKSWLTVQANMTLFFMGKNHKGRRFLRKKIHKTPLGEAKQILLPYIAYFFIKGKTHKTPLEIFFWTSIDDDRKGYKQTDLTDLLWERNTVPAEKIRWKRRIIKEANRAKVFNETTCAIQLTSVMYSFLQEPFFSLDFRMEFLLRHVHIVVIAQGEVL